MSEETKVTGVETLEAAAPVDNVQSEPQNSGGEQGNHVPLEALQAERAQRQNLQEELRVIRDHIALMQSQQSQPQATQKDEFDGVSEDDVLTVGELKKILSNKENQYQTSIQELKMAQKHPDYEQVVTQYLPEVLNQNPGLRKTLQSSQDYELAYHLAKNSDAYRASSKQVKKSADAERIVQNAGQAGSLSSMGSNSPVNQAKRYKDMSDEEFQKLINRNSGHF
jgi:hypothetical protein